MLPSSNYAIPTLASQVQKEFFNKEDIFALDINMACSGFVAGLKLIDSMLKDGEYGLLIGGEIFSQVIDFRTEIQLYYSGRQWCSFNRKIQE